MLFLLLLLFVVEHYSNMADTSKAERLAAARKKLQDFQRKKDILPVPNNNPPPAAPVLESYGVSTSEQNPKLNFEETTVPNVNLFGPTSTPQVPIGIPEHVPSYIPGEEMVSSGNPQATNGFQFSSSGMEYSHSNPYTSVPAPISSLHETPTVFCGNSYFNNGNSASSELFGTAGTNVNNYDYSQQGSFPPLQGASSSAYSTAHLFAQTNDAMAKWDLNPPPTSSPPDLTDTPVSIPTPHSEITEGEMPLFTKEEISLNEVPLMPLPQTEHKEPSENGSALILDDGVPQENTEPTIPVNGSFSAESIRQLSDQITQLIDPSVKEDEKQNSSFATLLESRNQELAAQLAVERRNNQQLQFTLKESQSQVSHLQSKVDDLQSQQEVILARHLGPLQEQLRAHAQTVGILVGEKTELEAAINHHTATAKQHASEVEELQNRLRASRHRVSELEKELTSVTASASASNKQTTNHVQAIDQLRLQNGMLAKQLDDAEEEASELRQKLGARVSEVASLAAQLQEKQSQLSLSQLRITQLSSSDNPEATAEIESLHQLKISLERRCTELTETVRQLSADRDQADQQYQQYVAQLNGQLQTAQSKLESVNMENDRLKNREEDLVRNMSELERQLQQQIQLHQHQQQQLQHNQFQQQAQQEPDQRPDNQVNLEDKISELQEERQRLQSSLASETQELANLRLKLEEKDAHIADLETLCNERPDQSRLLAAMESDKVAAAQATSQNTVLKQQLQELQDGFIKMSNDKLNLTESLEHEKHVNKEMGEKISQLAEELHELRVLVSEKERRLQEYREHELEHSHDDQNCNGSHDHNVSHGNNMKESSDHIHDKQQAHVTSSLQEQLSQAHEHIHNLSSQNNNLRRLINQKSTESHESGSSSSATEEVTTDDAAADHDTNCEDASDNHANYNCMQYAMEKLQERFTRTMGEVAELSDEKQRLEHLVLQLQGETETIGEYVALYQMQRAALQQRAREKDHQLASLSAEREDLRRKLQELNQLIQRLLEERGTETAKEALPVLEGLKENSTLRNETDVIEVPHIADHVDQDVTSDVAKRLSKKIMDIIEDISVTNDVETSFHPCPWCSGRLINV